MIYSHEKQTGGHNRSRLQRARASNLQPLSKFPEVPKPRVGHPSAVRPSRPRLHLCAPAMPSNPWKAFSSCHKCQRLRSRKINEPALRGQMTLSKISSSSFSSCLLSLYYPHVYSQDVAGRRKNTSWFSRLQGHGPALLFFRVFASSICE